MYPAKSYYYLIDGTINDLGKLVAYRISRLD